jgi:hypothetical protein
MQKAMQAIKDKEISIGNAGEKYSVQRTTILSRIQR